MSNRKGYQSQTLGIVLRHPTKQKYNPTASIDAGPMQTISAWEINTNDVAIKHTFEAGETNTNDPSDIGTIDAGNMSIIDKNVMNTADSSIVNRYNSTYKHMSTDDIPSITDPYTSAIFSSKQTKNPTVSEANEAATTGKQTSVSTLEKLKDMIEGVMSMVSYYVKSSYNSSQISKFTYTYSLFSL